MSTIKLKKAEQNLSVVNFHGNLDPRGSRGYESDVKFEQGECGKWIASITIDGMSAQETPEEAADRLSKYLSVMAKAVKGKNIKHLNIGGMFNAVHKK